MTAAYYRELAHEAEERTQRFERLTNQARMAGIIRGAGK